MPELVRLEHYGFTYPQQTRPALSDVELTIRDGEFWVLCGTSGCGKTTLLRQLKTVLRPHGAGRARVFRWAAAGAAADPRPGGGYRLRAAVPGEADRHRQGVARAGLRAGELGLGHARHPPPGGGDGVVLRHTGLVPPAGGRAVRRTEAAAGAGLRHGHAAAAADSGRAHQPARSHRRRPTFLPTLGRINRELGATVLVTEHRLEEALPLATHAAVLDGGRLLCAGAPETVGRALRGQGHDMFLAMPAAVRIWASVDADAPCPVTVREGRDFLADWCGSHPLRPLPPEPAYPAGEPVLTGEGLWFRYEKDADVVRGLDIRCAGASFWPCWAATARARPPAGSAGRSADALAGRRVAHRAAGRAAAESPVPVREKDRPAGSV